MGMLEGIRVLELSEVMQAPLSAQVLGDFGAEVIKIERPGRGDAIRGQDRHAVAAGLMSSYFTALNRNKRSVCLDLKSGQGREALLRLAAESDVLIHNYRPGAMERLGLSYDELSKVNPRLIYATATGYGEAGPLSHKGGQDLLAQSITGLARHSRRKEEPQLHPIPFVDYASGMSLAQGILVALWERQSSGRGQKVSISLFDSAIAMQTLEATSHLMYDFENNWIDDWFPNAAFQVSDGWITVLGFYREDALQRICRAFDIDDAVVRKYPDADQQAGHKEELNAILAGYFLRYDRDECIRRLDEVDVLCVPVLTIEEMLEHPQVQSNGMVIDVSVSGQPPARTIGNPVKLSRSAATVRSEVPLLGQHTETVLREMGFSDDEIKQMEYKE